MLTLARGHICLTLEGQGCLSQKLPFSVSMSADPSKNPDQKELVSRSTKKRQTNSILFLFKKKLEFLSDFHLVHITIYLVQKKREIHHFLSITEQNR